MGTPAYNKEHTKTILLRFNLRTDKDILQQMQAVGNKQAYIKRLIRADLALKHPDIDAYIDADAEADG